MVIKVGDKWCKATTTWKFWWNFLAKSIIFSRYPSFSPFERPDAYKCYIFSESYGSRETREIKISTSKFDLEAPGILSSLWTQTGPWSDTASYGHGQDRCWSALKKNTMVMKLWRGGRPGVARGKYTLFHEKLPPLSKRDPFFQTGALLQKFVNKGNIGTSEIMRLFI